MEGGRKGIKGRERGRKEGRKEEREEGRESGEQCYISLTDSQHDAEFNIFLTRNYPLHSPILVLLIFGPPVSTKRLQGSPHTRLLADLPQLVLQGAHTLIQLPFLFPKGLQGLLQSRNVHLQPLLRQLLFLAHSKMKISSVGHWSKLRTMYFLTSLGRVATQFVILRK